jgi:DNA polymerase I
MKTYKTNESNPGSLSTAEREWCYNGLDCAITAEVLEVLLHQLDNVTAKTYRFSLSLQAPVLDMRIRGIRVDTARRDQVVEDYYKRLGRLERNLDQIVMQSTGMLDFNWRSTTSLKELFYDHLRIPVIRYQGQPTVNRDALERMELYSVAKPIVRHLEAMRDINKKISMLQTEIDGDSRIRTSYNIGGTTTGRLSSSFSEFGTGTNLQNIEESLRSIFIADPGMKLAYFDAEQGESRVVGAIEGNLFGDWRYLDACESGDLHTNVAKLVWRDLLWTGEPDHDRRLAEQPYYRHYDRRFMCKKIGHGTNYGGGPSTLAAQAKVDRHLIEQFQPAYFAAFPAHQRWHAHVRKQIGETGCLTSLTGRRRRFWGRRNDDSVIREAIAYDPQGSLADIVNRGMLQVWRAGEAQLLLQIHDALVVQFPEEREHDIVPRLQAQLLAPIQLAGRSFTIPYGCKTGWNWGEYCCGNHTACKECKKMGNPNGLRKYNPSKERECTAPVSVLD